MKKWMAIVLVLAMALAAGCSKGKGTLQRIFHSPLQNQAFNSGADHKVLGLERVFEEKDFIAVVRIDDTLLENVLDIPKNIVPGKTPTMRCCVYKERAIVQERIKMV